MRGGGVVKISQHICGRGEDAAECAGIDHPVRSNLFEVGLMGMANHDHR